MTYGHKYILLFCKNSKAWKQECIFGINSNQVVGLQKVNLATLQQWVENYCCNYGGLFFSKHYYFRTFSMHCSKICTRKAFYLVKHCGMVASSFKYCYFRKFSTHVQQDKKPFICHVIFHLHISSSLLTKQEFQIQIVWVVIALKVS